MYSELRAIPSEAICWIGFTYVRKGVFSAAIILALGFIGCMVQSSSIAETMNNATGIPNVIGLVALSGWVVKCSLARGKNTDEILSEEL